MAKIHSLQDGYSTGDLSIYPEALDNKESLYEASNNAVTTLRQSLTYAGLVMVVNSTEKFPDKGVIKLSNEADSKSGELIYYTSKTSNTFKGLIRGFAGSARTPWNINSTVSNAVSAEHHNSLKDAIIKIETNLGLKNEPTEASLNGILKKQENRFLVTKPIFRAYPLKGSSPLTVTFQSFSTGPIVKYFWDFGDGNTSSEKNPVHTYYKEGSYTVELNVVGSLGGQGILTKSNYITVSDDEKIPFFYVSPLEGGPYSPENTTLFEFVDQTDGDIKERIWNFGGKGYLVNKLYPVQLINNTDYSILRINKKLKDIDLNQKCIIKTSSNNILKDIIQINQSMDGEKFYTDIKVSSLSDSNIIIQKVGFFKTSLIDQYTETDPNNHSVCFIYNIKQYASPSLFVLFKNQVIKKSFLKEKINIQ